MLSHTSTVRYPQRTIEKDLAGDGLATCNSHESEEQSTNDLHCSLIDGLFKLSVLLRMRTKVSNNSHGSWISSFVIDRLHPHPTLIPKHRAKAARIRFAQSLGTCRTDSRISLRKVGSRKQEASQIVAQRKCKVQPYQ
jgi:hypothetical protein